MSMEFKVKYIDESGKQNTDIFKFKNERELIENLKMKDFKILDINSLNKSSRELKIFDKTKIKDKKLTEFLKQFSILLKSGFEVKETLEVLYKQEKDKYLKRILSNLINDLDSGHTLGDSFRNTNAFPELVSGVIEAGEYSSNLAESVEILSEYYDNEIKIKESVRNATYYPVILIIVTLFIVIGIVTFVLPNYISLFESYENLELPRITKALISLNTLLTKYFFLIPIFVVTMGLLIRIVMRDDSLKIKFAKILLHLPLLGDYLTNLEIQRFSGVFSLLVKSGVNTIEVIEISSNSLSNTFLKSKILESKDDVFKGNSIYDSFSKIRELPEIFLNLINVGETSSNLGKTMKISYGYFKDLTLNQGKKFTAIFEPLIIIFVSLLVGTIVIGIALPTFDIVNIL